MSRVAPNSLPGILASTLAPRALAASCSDHDQIARVMGVKGIARLCAKSSFNAVYVISPDDIPVSKVGVTNDPISRLQGLQCGNWNRLFVRSLFWCASGAYDLETAVLAKLRSFRVRLEGEWAGISAEDMATLVAKCAHELSLGIGTSGLYVDHWIGWSADRMQRIKDEAA